MPINSEALSSKDDHDELRRSEAQAMVAHSTILQAILATRSDLNLEGKIISTGQKGSGTYSDIFTGYVKSGSGEETKVAVKRLRVQTTNDEEFQKRLAQEVLTWSKLVHPRILPLEGFYLEYNDYPAFVSKWMENGTVLGYLIANPHADILALVMGIAQGINYLHANNIVHSDIKPDNVLISDSGEPLLCDIGISRMLTSSAVFNCSGPVSSAVRSTVRYMSKELLNISNSSPATYSRASDVWAFGMTVVTLLTKNPPFSDLQIDSQVLFAIALGTLPRPPSDIETWPVQNRVLWRICECCWRSPAERPTMQGLLHELTSLTNELSAVRQTPPPDTNPFTYEFRWLKSVPPAPVSSRSSSFDSRHTLNNQRSRRRTSSLPMTASHISNVSGANLHQEKMMERIKESLERRAELHVQKKLLHDKTP